MNGTALAEKLTGPGSIWLEAARSAVHDEPAALTYYFPAVSRRCGRDPLNDFDPHGARHGCVDDAARGVLLSALTLRGPARLALLEDLYRHGDAGEKRGLLRGLHLLGELGPALLPLVEDALRTNDVRLVAAAVQVYGARHLGQEAYRHAVVKCVFTGIPLQAIPNLAARQDGELARMLVDLAHERTAAGRDIPADIHAVVAAFPDCLDRPDLCVELLSALLPETAAPNPE